MLVPLTLGALALSGCTDVSSGGPQDVDERPGQYPVEVVESRFEDNQKLAKRSRLTIVVRNAGPEVIPNVAVTLGANENSTGLNDSSDNQSRVGTFSRRRDDENQADPKRPQFVINKAPIDYYRGPSRAVDRNPPDTRAFELEQSQDADSSDIQREVRTDVGDEPTYVDTYPLGRLDPGKSRRFTWNVTAIEAGPYAIRWRVHAGLDGNRVKAVLGDGGGLPTGEFAGFVRGTAPPAKVSFGDGRSIEGSVEP